MAEIVVDPTTGDRVIISSARASRPRDFSVREEVVESDEGSCPFCPGNEHMTPPETFRIPGESGGWKVRVVPNKYPAIDTAAGGVHEVVIDSPEHHTHIFEYEREQVVAILTAIRERMRAIAMMEGIEYVQAFRNHGSVAGASLHHNHSQIIGLPFVPPRVARELDYTRGKDCPWCALAGSSELVWENSGYFAVTVPWGRFPYETWIIPREHHGDFASGQDLAGLAEGLQAVIGGMYSIFPDMPYTMHIHTSPTKGDWGHYHWHVEITPYLTIPAGFERASDCFINPLPATVAAEALRAAIRDG